MPAGLAVPVDGGYRFSGRWSFSSGCDVSDWIILGGLTADAADAPGTIDMAQAIADPNRYLHLILPRSDYSIVEGTWDVIGLSGTGSKDIVVEDAFIPAYRTVRAIDIVEGTTPGHDTLPPTHRMSWGSIFPNAITSAIIGIAEGAADAAFDFQRSRISMGAGGPVVGAPVTMSAIGHAAGEIDACRAQLPPEHRGPLGVCTGRRAAAGASPRTGPVAEPGGGPLAGCNAGGRRSPRPGRWGGPPQSHALSRRNAACDAHARSAPCHQHNREIGPQLSQRRKGLRLPAALVTVQRAAS